MNCANYWFATGGFGQAFREMFWLGFLVHLQPKPRPLWGENGLCCVLASAFTGRKSTQLTLCIVVLAQHWSHFASTPSAGVDHSICSYQPCIDCFGGPALELRYNVRLSKEEPGGTYPSKAWENICTKNHLQSHDEHCMPEALAEALPGPGWSQSWSACSLLWGRPHGGTVNAFHHLFRCSAMQFESRIKTQTIVKFPKRELCAV